MPFHHLTVQVQLRMTILEGLEKQIFPRKNDIFFLPLIFAEMK